MTVQLLRYNRFKNGSHIKTIKNRGVMAVGYKGDVYIRFSRADITDDNEKRVPAILIKLLNAEFLSLKITREAAHALIICLEDALKSIDK